MLYAFPTWRSLPRGKKIRQFTSKAFAASSSQKITFASLPQAGLFFCFPATAFCSEMRKASSHFSESVKFPSPPADKNSPNCSNKVQFGLFFPSHRLGMASAKGCMASISGRLYGIKAPLAFNPLKIKAALPTQRESSPGRQSPRHVFRHRQKIRGRRKALSPLPRQRLSRLE